MRLRVILRIVNPIVFLFHLPPLLVTLKPDFFVLRYHPRPRQVLLFRGRLQHLFYLLIMAEQR